MSNSKIVFSCISPHPPLLLPYVGSEKDKKQVKKTIKALEGLSGEIKKLNPDSIIISSPHPDWGFQVPLYFLAKDFQGKTERVLTGLESPDFYFEEGEKLYYSKIKDQSRKIALIASGDLSHCLKSDGPYGFHPQGPEFDKELAVLLKKKDIKGILNLDEKYPQAGECGLRPISFVLGILRAAQIDWQPEILSYENPFGVGYLVVNFKIK